MSIKKATEMHPSHTEEMKMYIQVKYRKATQREKNDVSAPEAKKKKKKKKD